MNRKTLAGLGAAAGMTALATMGAIAYAGEPDGQIATLTSRGLEVIPASSIVRAEDVGVRAHTNVRMMFRSGKITPSGSPIVGFENPASLGCVYGFTPAVKGCNPTTLTAVPTGGSKLIVIVDAYDDPTAANDLSVYSTQYGLPAITANNFQVAYGSGSKPKQDSSGGWEFEESLDIEMAHAMAPNAKVVLMEAASSSFADFATAEKAAAKLVEAAGGGEVSNSWSGSETSSENNTESTYTGTGVVFFASTGDDISTGQPAVLQNVVAAGGTDITRDQNYNYVSQPAWNDAGAGKSKYVPIPSYQSAEKKVKKIVGTARGVPDFSFDSGPDGPVSVYDTTPYNGSVLGWTGAYGTSVASPALAGVINAAGSFASSTSAELTTAYAGYTNVANWSDITTGTCGPNGSLKTKKGYDLCTGIGVPNGYGGK